MNDTNTTSDTSAAPEAASCEMPRYVCHKQVHALKIAGVFRIGDPGDEDEGTRVLGFVDAKYAPMRVSREYVHKHNPKAGGYYVLYEDGYASFSPADAFEKGYTLSVSVEPPKMDNTAGKSPHHLLTDHKVNGLNDAITAMVCDEPGPGGAHHLYRLFLNEKPEWPYTKMIEIVFQNGPIKEAGFNGFTNEVLLAVLIDRMRGFQSGPYKSRDNACALTHMEEALMWLQKRTRDRLARGVEGTHAV